MTGWDQIERRLGIADLEAFVRREIEPLLTDLPLEEEKKNGGYANRLELPMTIGFFGFGAAFFALNIILPDSFLGVLARFVLFPVMFFGFLIGAFYLFRDRLAETLTRGKVRYIGQAKALTALAGKLDLTYVPSPGGAPDALKFIARQTWAPAALADAVSILDDHGGMDEALAIARASGAMLGDAKVLASGEQKQKIQEQQAAWRQVEDGFQGVRAGVAFSAFEWVESVEDAADIYHLVLVFQSPYRLSGVTHLRTRHIAWPGVQDDLALKPVGVVAPAFEDRFHMRASDQMEARLIFDPVVLERVAGIAHGEKVRAVAFDDHLVFDVAGENRFTMVDLITGAWSEETIAATIDHIADMLALADAVSHAFKLRSAA